MNRTKRVIMIVLALVLLFSTSAFASTTLNRDVRGVNIPKLNAIGTTAICECRVSFSGQYIDATMELWQGSTLIASWHRTGNGHVDFSETATIVNGLSYTLL